ncbi:MAG: GNAT family N-acetyltransferase [Actinomycetota bacterium]|nr:GNAT family N-acetyltransferase [Actinomycetota bacterium]
MLLRAYRDTDARATLDVFLAAIRTTAAADYSPEQIAAWSDVDDLDSWHAAREASNTRVAEIDERVVGFTDVAPDGYIDMLFVHPGVVRRGVASALLAWADATARESGATELTTFASVTARRFFSARGFATDEERYPEVRGVRLTNYRMSLPLGAADAATH